MKRTLLLYGLLAIVLVVGASYVTGLFAQQRFQELINVISQSEPVQITTLEYKRGVFQSKAKTRVVLSGERLIAFLQMLEQEVSIKSHPARSTINLILEHAISHGPFVRNKTTENNGWSFALAQITSTLFLSEEAKASLEKEIGEKDFLLFHTILALGDDISITLDGKPIQVLQNGVDETIWQGIQAKWDISETLDLLQGTIVIPGLYFEQHNTIYEAENVLFNSERYLKPESEKNSWQENAHYKIDRFTIHGEAKQKISFYGITANLNEETKMIDAQINKLEIAGQVFGPLAIKAVFNTSLVAGRISVKPNLLKMMYQYQFGAAQADLVDRKIVENIEQKIIQENDGFYETRFQWSKGRLALP